MSATRNPFYQLPGNADIPGDVRVSDTADASKTAADGWAASPAAVASLSAVTHGTIVENQVFWYRIGNLVCVIGNGVNLSSIAKWSMTTLGTLPFKPIITTRAPVVLAYNNPSITFNCIVVTANTNGSLQLQSWGDIAYTDISVHFTLCYFCE